MEAQSWRKVKSAEILGLSLTELLLLLTFALLLIMGIFFRDLQALREVKDNLDAVRSASQSIADKAIKVDGAYFDKEIAEVAPETLVDQLQLGNDVLEHLIEEANKESARAALEKRPFPEIWTALVRADADADELEKLRREMEELKTLLAQREADLVERQKESEQLKDAFEKIAKALGNPKNKDGDEIAGQVADLTEEHTNMKGQLKMQQRLGLDHPPCWADPDGNIEYTYDVTVKAGELIVKPIWPAHRAESLTKIELRNIPDPTALTISEFKTAMLPFLTYGKQATAECRFFVKLRDGTGDTAKLDWKLGSKIVQGYFYRREVN